MSSWQVFSDADNYYRWEQTGRVKAAKPEVDQDAATVQPHDFSCRLPSMGDLLLQGCSKILKKRSEANSGSSPAFQTGLGKSVVPLPSSIAKALSVIAGDDNNDGGGAICYGRAKDRKNGNEGNGGSSPIFRSGLGNSFVSKQSAMAKALSILGTDDDACEAIHKASVDAGENQCGFSNSLFHTGSGRTVNVSSGGLVRAKRLLGLEDSDPNEEIEGFELTRTTSTTSRQYERKSILHLKNSEDTSSRQTDSKQVLWPQLNSAACFVGSMAQNEPNLNIMQSEKHDTSSKPPPIMFQTAGGRSLSVSNDALLRAGSLLGAPDFGNIIDMGGTDDSSLLFNGWQASNDTSSNKENKFYTPFTRLGTAASKQNPKIFTSPLRSSSRQTRSLVDSENKLSRSNLMEKFDEVENDRLSRPDSSASSMQRPLSDSHCAPSTIINDSRENQNGSKIHQNGSRHLVDITNRIETAHMKTKQGRTEQSRFGSRSATSSFKRPRSSRFSTPMKRNAPNTSNGISALSSESFCFKRVVSTRYPFRDSRISLKEFFKTPEINWSMLECLPENVRRITANNSSEYFFDDSRLNNIGAEAFLHMLSQSGASLQYITKEWVMNHYKWVVWKLACYERYYPDRSALKILTISNVLEEMKYRYEREVNHGHRSAIKRILEGDALPSSMMVLCISAIYSNKELSIKAQPLAPNAAEDTNGAKVELTDGWYSVDALLDLALSKQLATRKIFVGQKLRLLGAGLCGWVGPVSPLEASKTACLSLHINGTYRTHWADRLGFCKDRATPLAFRCIKSNGGPVPCTLVGVTRIYPIIFKEKLRSGGSIVRSENMESKMIELNNQRRSTLVEGIISEFQRENQSSNMNNDTDDSEEGAQICKMLEAAAEPEVLMAGLSAEQFSSFSCYQAKLETARQLNIEKSISKAIVDAGLEERQVTPFLRVRVVGLVSRTNRGNGSSIEGIITIWSPTEKQIKDLIEGKSYAVAGLLPSNSESDILYLQSRGSTTRWKSLSPKASQQFEPFFNPREPVVMSNLGAVPFSSEFDIAACVIHVGEVYMAAHQKKQWVFVTDGSVSGIQSEEDLSKCLLAISFSSPYADEDPFAPVNFNLAGSTVGFYNLIKKAKDQTNHMWVAEATENSSYSFNFDKSNHSHLKKASISAQQWAKISSNSIINNLKEKVLSITGDNNS